MDNPKTLTSIVSYPERGDGGNNRYRGNCSPKLIEDLIKFFKPKEICDYMCGSGTTKDAADKCGIKSCIYDLHSGFDIMNCDIQERPEFIFWHPPYWDIIKYSDVMYKASEVERRYGYNPMKYDLSRILEWNSFVETMNYAMMKQFSSLEKGGRMAVLMGDIKKKVGCTVCCPKSLSQVLWRISLSRLSTTVFRIIQPTAARLSRFCMNM